MALYHSSYTDRYGHTYNVADGDINYSNFIAKTGVSVITADNESDSDVITIVGEPTISSFADATYTGGDSKVLLLWNKNIVMGATDNDTRFGLTAGGAEQIYFINCRITFYSQDNSDKANIFNSNANGVDLTGTPDRESHSDIGLINCTIVCMSNRRIEEGQGGGTSTLGLGDFTHSTLTTGVQNPDRIVVSPANQGILDNFLIDWNFADNNSITGFLYFMITLNAQPASTKGLGLTRNTLRFNAANIFIDAGYNVNNASVFGDVDGRATAHAIVSTNGCPTFISPSTELREDGNIGHINSGTSRLIVSQGYQPVAYKTGLLDPDEASDQVRYRFTTNVRYNNNGTNITIGNTSLVNTVQTFTTDSDGIPTADGTYNWRNGTALTSGDTVETFEIPVVVAVKVGSSSNTYESDYTYFSTSLESFSLFGTYSESLSFNGSDDATEAFNADGSVDFINQNIVDSADAHMAKYSRDIDNITDAVGTQVAITLSEFYAGYKLAIYEGSLDISDIVEPDADGVWDITGETVNKLHVDPSSILAGDDQFTTGFAINDTGSSDTLIVLGNSLTSGTSTISRAIVTAFDAEDTTISADITTNNFSNVRLSSSNPAFKDCEPKGQLVIATGTSDRNITFDNCELGGLQISTSGTGEVLVNGAQSDDFESITSSITFPAASYTIELADGLSSDNLVVYRGDTVETLASGGVLSNVLSTDVVDIIYTEIGKTDYFLRVGPVSAEDTTYSVSTTNESLPSLTVTVADYFDAPEVTSDKLVIDVTDDLSSSAQVNASVMNLVKETDEYREILHIAGQADIIFSKGDLSSASCARDYVTFLSTSPQSIGFVEDRDLGEVSSSELNPSTSTELADGNFVDIGVTILDPSAFDPGITASQISAATDIITGNVDGNTLPLKNALGWLVSTGDSSDVTATGGSLVGIAPKSEDFDKDNNDFGDVL